jgi:hypothetical protein
MSLLSNIVAIYFALAVLIAAPNYATEYQPADFYLIPRNTTICDVSGSYEEPGEDCIEDAHRTYVVRLWSKSEQGWCFVIRWAIPNSTRPGQGRVWKKFVECKNLIHLPQSPPAEMRRPPLEKKI